MVASGAEITPSTQLPFASRDTLAEDFSPAAVLQEAYGQTPVQQQAFQSSIQPHIPQTSYQATIQNSQLPWPAVPSAAPQVPPVTGGTQVMTHVSQNVPPLPIPPSTTPAPSTSQAMQNLQKAIADARTKATQQK